MNNGHFLRKVQKLKISLLEKNIISNFEYMTMIHLG